MNSLFISDSNRKITEVGLSCSSAKLMPIGSILLCTRATIGELAIAEKPMATNQGFKNLVCKPDVNNIYFAYLLMTLKPEMIKRAIGTTFLEISKTELGDIDVMLPSFPEQEAIAETITAFDTHIENLSALIEKKRAIRDGALEDLISGRTRLEGFGGKVTETVLLGSLQEVKRGKRLVRSQLYRNGKFPVYQNSLEPLGYYDEANCLAESAFVIAAGNAGDIGFSETAFWAADDCYYFEHSEDLCQKYLYYSLLYKQSNIYTQTRRTSIPRLSRDILEKIPLLFPHVKEQEAIASVLTSMDEEITALEAERDKIAQIREGVMDDLLTGRVRLKV